jgi:hypothetical protein
MGSHDPAGGRRSLSETQPKLGLIDPCAAVRMAPAGSIQQRHHDQAMSIDLYWLPLGAGGHFVRLNGRIYEAVTARRERRRPLDLYHTALVVTVPDGRFIVENAWPIPDGDGVSRGVVLEGPVGSRRFGRFRVLRYEVRRWRNGVIADAGEAVASPQRVSDDVGQARQILHLVESMPALVWGRDELGVGEMWNSNSVIAWVLARSGLPADAIHPPEGGRAPGWAAGLVLASRQAQGEVGVAPDQQGRWLRNRRVAAG